VTPRVEGLQPSTLPMGIRVPTPGYLNEFLSLKCAPDLLKAQLFPNAKEITESQAAYHAAVKVLGVKALADPSIRVLVVGDGSTPRTGALFAFRSKWQVTSVDPALTKHPRTPGVEKMARQWEPLVHRLTVLPMKVEEMPAMPSTGSPVIVVAVHSHASLSAALDRLPLSIPFLAIAIPCCIPQRIGLPPSDEWEDWGIWSPQRTVKVWDLGASYYTRSL
jgi:hypothetical protein